MSNRSAKPITVTLGPLGESVQARVASGRFASASEVLRAGLRALDREEAALDALLKAKVAEALADTSPLRANEQVFAELRAHHAKRK